MRTSQVTLIAVLAAMVCAVLPAWSAELPVRRSELGADAIPGNGTTLGRVQPPRSSRLRFRAGGPTCMCVSGMSDAQIEAAERERSGAPADLENINQNP